MLGVRRLDSTFRPTPKLAKPASPVETKAEPQAATAAVASTSAPQPSRVSSAVQAALAGARGAPTLASSSAVIDKSTFGQRIRDFMSRFAAPVAAAAMGAALVTAGTAQGATLETVVQSKVPEAVQVLGGNDPSATLADTLQTNAMIEKPVETSTIRLGANEWLSHVAQRYDVTLETLLSLNPGISNPNRVSEGQEINVPPSAAAEVEVYIVRRGDAFDRVAADHGLDRSGLLALNPEVSNPHAIVPGQRLRVSGEAPSWSTPQTLVKSGDSLWKIARREGVAFSDILAWNPALARADLQVGDVVKLAAPRESGRIDPDLPPRVADATPATPTVNGEPAPEPVVVADPVVAAPVVVPTAPAANDPVNVEQSPATVLVGQDGIVDPSGLPTIRAGKAAPEVATTIAQNRLANLGFLPESGIDGDFGNGTLTATASFQYANGLHVDGVIGPQTWGAMMSPDAERAGPASQRYAPGAVYAPRSAALIALFREAAPLAGVPTSWATNRAVHNLVDAESNGVTGIPNYTYGRDLPTSRYLPIHGDLRRGRIRAESSATGIGQLLLRNVDVFYPSGRDGIGVPLEEAAGMLAYIKDRWTTPERAWRNYNVLHEGY